MPECAPFDWRSEQLDAAIQAGLEAGICFNPDELASHVADVVYPTDMEGVPIPWPKQDPWHLGVLPEAIDCLWERIRVRTTARLADWADRYCPTTEGADFEGLVGAWESPLPRCGFHYQAQRFGHSSWTEHETLGHIAREALAAELEIAGYPPEAVDEVDRNGVRFRIKRMASLIEETNDRIYGSSVRELGTERNPGVGHWSPTGRGVSFNPVHANNRDRLATGRSVRRAVVVGGRADGKNARHDGTGGHLPYLWITVLDRGRLAASPNDIVADRGAWPDGSSGDRPPLEFRAQYEHAENV